MGICYTALMESPENEREQIEEANVFVTQCHRLANEEWDQPLALFAGLLLEYARRPLPEGLEVWLDDLKVSAGAPAFRTVHRAVHTLLSRYVALQFDREVNRQELVPGEFPSTDWMTLVATEEARLAFAPVLPPEEVENFWFSLWNFFNPGMGLAPELEDLNSLILPPSPFPLVLVVDMLTPTPHHPALFAVRLPNGTLQPVGEWIEAHWQEPEQLHALTEQWNAMVAACFIERQRLEMTLYAPFTLDDDWLIDLTSEDFRSQLAWFNCTLLGRIPQWVKPQDITVRGKLGERSLSGEFNAQALLDFSYEVVLDGQVLSDEDLANLLNADPDTPFAIGEKLFPSALRYRLLNQLKALRGLDTACSGKALSLFEGMRLISGLPVRNFANDGSLPHHYQVSTQLNHFLNGTLTRPMPALPEATAQCLRPYQREGVRFLWEGTERGLGVCLADDMGLGKTLQVLALLQLWKRAGVMADAPVLIIVPPTLLENWRTEQQRWAPELSLKICHPKWMDAEAWKQLIKDPEEALFGVDIALFSYQMISRVSALLQVDFPAIILDEAQAIKNPGSRQSQAVRELYGERRIVLTGTPVENSLLDLWTLFDFLNPGLLGPQEQIRRMNLHPETFMPALRQLVKPFLLRRQKGDPGILEELPEKHEQLVPCVLTPDQALAYRQLVETLREGLKVATDRFSRGGLVLRTLVRLKQICNHPAQLIHAVDYPPEQSGKFLKLLELAGEIVAAGEKFLLFTQFYEIIAPLHTLLAQRLGCPGFVLHGSTPVDERKARVEAFQRHVGPAFFIISLRAGGVGLNLTAATHVIHFDRWWNPAVENQASDRAHRIGQHHRVTIHKFICHGTLEERIDALIEQKRALSDELLRAGPEKLLTAMSNAELLDLVRLASPEETP
ncbi:MAG: DEAD/DEAH box helicase [Candidatus Spyradenecus sp.]